MKDFTKPAAAAWVRREAAKVTTAAAIRNRINIARTFVGMVSDEYKAREPNAYRAHLDLITILERKFTESL